MVDRRDFLICATTTLGMLATRPSAAEPAADPLRNMIVVNGLGTLDNEYGPKPPGPPSLVSAGALAAAKASGMAAIDLTMSAGDSFEKAVASVARWDAFIRNHPADLKKVFFTADVRQAKARKKIGIIYGFQNAAMVGDEVSRIDIFADMGVKVIQLTYNSRNQLGGGSMAAGDPGLTPFGRQVIERLNARRVMVDLSHSGHRMCLDSGRASRQPISINHTGCAAITSLPRNKTDEELRLVAERGGYVGIYFMMYLTRGRPSNSSDVVAHLDHAIDVCGEDHVGIGSDYGIVELGDMSAEWKFWRNLLRKRRAAGIAATGENPDILPFASDLIGPDQFRTLVRVMDRHGYSSSRIEKVMGGNYLRHAKEVWGA